ncbi:MBL fold metallo-hydrolase [Pseudoxanthobacter sp.]|uniref:MBL fold metallo-hydrolase n=1 Tax=Pseudoxanthobacter sp. TaxID=1925742 RepID=UPI002FDF6347
MAELKLTQDFDPDWGRAVEVAPGVRRLTARNPGPFTFHGTNTYLVGEQEIAVIDPGPDDEAHVAAIVAAAGGRPVSAIVVTHTHRDHSPAAARLAALTGAPTFGEGPHRPARPGAGGAGAGEASGDMAFRPDRVLADGDSVSGAGFRLSAVATPGHTANHLAFALEGTGVLFSGDHVMAWSTTVVAPPDGDMGDYMASLARLGARNDRLCLPGHGGAVTEPAAHIAGLTAHRLAREAAILDAVVRGAHDVPAIVAAVYRGLDPRLVAAAGLSVSAHLQALADRGLVTTAPDGTLRAAV